MGGRFVEPENNEALQRVGLTSFQIMVPEKADEKERKAPYAKRAAVFADESLLPPHPGPLPWGEGGNISSADDSLSGVWFANGERVLLRGVEGAAGGIVLLVPGNEEASKLLRQSLATTQKSSLHTTT